MIDDSKSSFALCLLLIRESVRDRWCHTVHTASQKDDNPMAAIRFLLSWFLYMFCLFVLLLPFSDFDLPLPACETLASATKYLPRLLHFLLSRVIPSPSASSLYSSSFISASSFPAFPSFLFGRNNNLSLPPSPSSSSLTNRNV